MTDVRDIAPEEAWRLLQSDKNAQLVDCRTKAEWNFVGVPDLSALGKKTVFVEWQGFPNTGPNPNFVAELGAQGLKKDQVLVFICRSGGRSLSAAKLAVQNGFAVCHNLAGGFEGDLDSFHHRGQVGGWKRAGLPWTQG
jgi:rhodanese-related sulfurtransferase